MTLVAICMPCLDMVHRYHSMTLASITSSCAKDGIDTAVVYAAASMGAVKGRNMCLDAVTELETQGHTVDWLFWLDTDMIVPERTIQALLSHEKDIVGATYVRRSPPYDLMGHIPLGADGKPQNVQGIVEADRLPTGVLLTRRSVFRDLPRPVFRLGINEEKGDFIGEDYYFCEQAKANGHKLWLDVTLSLRVGHIGEAVYWTHEHPNAQPAAKPQLVVPQTPSLVGLRANGRG
jgi:hypothetical protein